jgi:hypothetical protein
MPLVQVPLMQGQEVLVSPLVVELPVPVPVPVPVPLVVSNRVGQNQNHHYLSMLVVRNRVGHSSVRFGLRQ